MAAGLEAITEATSDVAVDVSLLSGIRSADHGLGASVEEILKVWGSALEARVAGGLLAVRALGLIRLHGRALVLELRLASVLLSWDLVWALEPLESKTTLKMPDDMAMHQPCAWVIGLETDDGIP